MVVNKKLFVSFMFLLGIFVPTWIFSSTTLVSATITVCRYEDTSRTPTRYIDQVWPGDASPCSETFGGGGLYDTVVDESQTMNGENILEVSCNPSGGQITNASGSCVAPASGGGTGGTGGTGSGGGTGGGGSTACPAGTRRVSDGSCQPIGGGTGGGGQACLPADSADQLAPGQVVCEEGEEPGGDSGSGGGTASENTTDKDIVDYAELCTESVDKTDNTKSSCDCNESGELNASNCEIVKYIEIGINTMTGLAGLAIVAGIMTGGYMYMTARDNPGQTAAGRQRVVWALVALLIMTFSWGFLQWLVPGGVL